MLTGKEFANALIVLQNSGNNLQIVRQITRQSTEYSWYDEEHSIIDMDENKMKTR